MKEATCKFKHKETIIVSKLQLSCKHDLGPNNKYPKVVL